MNIDIRFNSEAANRRPALMVQNLAYQLEICIERRADELAAAEGLADGKEFPVTVGGPGFLVEPLSWMISVPAPGGRGLAARYMVTPRMRGDLTLTIQVLETDGDGVRQTLRIPYIVVEGALPVRREAGAES